MVKKICNLLLFIVLYTMDLPAQTGEMIRVSSFDKVEVNGGFEVDFRLCDSEMVTLVSGKADREDIRIEVKGRTLSLAMKKALLSSTSGVPVRVVVCYRALRQVEAAAQSALTFREALKGDYLVVKARTGATISLTSALTTLEATATQGAELNLQGSCPVLEAKANTGALIQAYAMVADDALVTANTGGKVYVTVHGKLEADAGTGGQIDYRGDPAELSVSESLGGTINPR